MDFLYLSPEFPPNYANFIYALDEMNINVWGIGEADFYFMPEKLRAALKWYVQTDLNSIQAVGKALDTLLDAKAALGASRTFDLVESHNEQWLRLEGFINARLGIRGFQPQDLDRIKKKSAMKMLFKEAGLPVAKGERVRDYAHGVRLAREVGFPLILKPDEGVGAGGIHKVMDTNQLKQVLNAIDPAQMLMEEFVDAGIVTYDGLVDSSGRICFENSLIYGAGVLDSVLGQDTFLYVRRHIPEQLTRIGRQLVRLFGIRRKFFHFEFFVLDDGYMPIEINCRPPGGAILDMMNYSIDDDLYAAYARMIAHGETEVATEKKYYCCYLGRREREYRHSHSEIMAKYSHCLVEFAENPPVFQAAMGKYRYLLRSPLEEEILQMADFVLQKR